MKRIFVLLFAAPIFFSCSDDHHSLENLAGNRALENPDYIQLRMVKDSYQEGVPEYDDPQNAGGTIQLQEEILLDLSHVKRVEWIKREDSDVFDVRIEFNEEGTQKFGAITRDNKGKKVALFVNGELIMMPTIMAEITNGRIPIFFDLSEEDAKSRAEKIGEQFGKYAP